MGTLRYSLHWDMSGSNWMMGKIIEETPIIFVVFKHGKTKVSCRLSLP